MSNIEFPSLHPTTPFDEALRRIAALSEYLDNINELADTLISQNVWLIGRIRELEDQIYNLELGATSGNGIGHQQQGQHIRGHAQQQQQLYNSLFSPTTSSSFANHPTHQMNNNNFDGRQQLPQAIPPLLTSFNFLTLGQRNGGLNHN